MIKSTLFRVILICSLCIALTTAKAQYVAIPDSNFGKWLYSSGYSSCLIGNGSIGYQLDTTCAAGLPISQMTIAPGATINDITGIQYLKDLLQVQISYSHILTVSAWPPSLQILNISSNEHLQNLGVLPDSLQQLACDGCYVLDTLPTLPNTLTSLSCSSNSIRSLPELPESLEFLRCSSNQLTALPILPSNLIQLICYHNQLTNLPLLPQSLALLNCDYNQLMALPALPDYLSTLDCSYNQLTALPQLPYGLAELYCNHNLALSCLPIIYQHPMTFFYIDSTNITCLPDTFTARQYDINPAALPLCDSIGGCHPLGIVDVNNENITLYPNPNKGSFTLLTTNSINSDYTVSDMTGNTIIQKSIKSNTEYIDLHDATEGVYTLVVKRAQPLRFVIFK